jgi:hypothetical protein
VAGYVLEGRGCILDRGVGIVFTTTLLIRLDDMELSVVINSEISLICWY